MSDIISIGDYKKKQAYKKKIMETYTKGNIPLTHLDIIPDDYDKEIITLMKQLTEMFEIFDQENK